MYLHGAVARGREMLVSSKLEQKGMICIVRVSIMTLGDCAGDIPLKKKKQVPHGSG